MAADEVLLEKASAGQASLRFYGWSHPTLSLGYFQPERLRLEDEHLAQLPYVRRPSGGMTLVHHHEITYALAVPAGAPWHSRDSWLRRMHRIIAAALRKFGIEVHLHQAQPCERSFGPLCFHHLTEGDLLLGAAKVVGSAQRKQRGALLQHGGILLACSPHTPTLPGIRELSGISLDVSETCTAIQNGLTAETGWDVLLEDWTIQERQRIEEITASKYTQSTWNDRR